MWWIYALLGAVFAGLTAVLAKAGIRGVDPDLATAVRTADVLMIAWGIVFAKNGLAGFSCLTRTNLIFPCLSGIATGLSWIFYFRALQAGRVSYVAPIDKASVLIAVLFSVAFLGEPLTLKVAAGVLLIVAGSVIIIV